MNIEAPIRVPHGRPAPALQFLRLLALAMLTTSASAQIHGTIAYRDCAACPEMVNIPAGDFLMGTAPGEEDRELLGDTFRNRSHPRHMVDVRRFSAGRFEVTRGQYRVFVQATRHTGDGCFAWNGTEFEMDPSKSWRSPGYAQDDNHPAACVSWEDASAYASWLSRTTGRRYRLLSEAEWEYAARAGTLGARYWEDAGGASCLYANGADATTEAHVPDARNWGAMNCSDGRAYTAPVGSFRANAFGLHDMLGNVAEWTQDCWNANYDGVPTDGRAWDSGDCAMRAVRGGAWNESPAGLRAAYRVGSPVVIRVDGRGFRVARDE